MDKSKQLSDKINKLVLEIEQLVKQSDIENIDNLLNYKFSALKTLEIKQCKTCGKIFIPKYENKFQQFCGYDCLYKSTKATRKYKISTDVSFRRVDNLRKAIYERKYRASKIGKSLKNANIYNTILADLKVLRKKENYISPTEYNRILDELCKKYKDVSRLEK